MKTTSYFRLNKKALIMALVSAAYPSIGFSAAAAKVEFAVGNVLATGLDGRERSLGKGGEINAGDTVQTQEGRAQLRFSDGGYISLQPNTQFRVDEYAYDGKTDGHEKGFFSLLRGGLRAITGAVGHVNKATYRINTPVATIGIRGTEFLAQYNGTLLVKVGNGAVYLTNSGGDLTLFKGQVGEVKDQGSKPKYSNEEPSVTAAGPKGGTPAAVQQQSQQEQQQSETFTVAEQYNADGTSCVVTGTCPVVTSASPTAFKTLTSQGVSIAHFQDPPSGMYAQLESTVTGTVELDSAGKITKISGDDYSVTNFTGTWTELTNDKDLSWGRLTGGTAQVTDSGGTSIFDVSNVHFIYGNPTPLADIAALHASSVSGFYSLAGGTSPTDALGNVGTLSSGSIAVDFGAYTVSTNMTVIMSAGPAASGGSSGAYYLSGSGTVGANGQFVATNVIGSSCCGNCFGAAGFFAGPNAAQAGLSYFVDSGTTAGHITGTAAFNKSTAF
jgi:hypothetical protein